MRQSCHSLHHRLPSTFINIYHELSLVAHGSQYHLYNKCRYHDLVWSTKANWITSGETDETSRANVVMGELEIKFYIKLQFNCRWRASCLWDNVQLNNEFEFMLIEHRQQLKLAEGLMLILSAQHYGVALCWCTTTNTTVQLIRNSLSYTNKQCNDGLFVSRSLWSERSVCMSIPRDTLLQLTFAGNVVEVINDWEKCYPRGE